MNRFHLLLPLLAASLLPACGGSTQIFLEDDGNGQPGAGGSDSQPLSCELPAAGEAFTFTVRNVGMRELALTYECGSNMPILLQTPDGERGIGPGNASFCEVSCDQVYDGYENWGCSDCGPGYGHVLMPGGEVTITWDRRYYVEHTAPSACSGNEDGNSCSLGMPARVGEITAGRLEFCTDAEAQGYCYSGATEVVPFQLDLSQDAMIIEIE